MVLTLEQLRNGRRDVPFAGEESGATCQARDGADLAGFFDCDTAKINHLLCRWREDL